MLLLLALLGLVAGALTVAASLLRTLRANAGSRMPYFGAPEVIPRGTIAGRSIGVALLIMSLGLLGAVVGTVQGSGVMSAAFLVVIAGLLVLVVAVLVPIVVHNARVS